jgi:hypothetical protein
MPFFVRVSNPAYLLLFRQFLTRAPGPQSTLPADGHSVQTDLQTLPPAQPALASQVLAMLAQCCREGPLRVNQFPGQVFVQAEETLVVVPEAFKAVRERLGKPAVTLAVLRVPNAILWGATPPAAFAGELVVAPQTATAATDAA